MNGDEFFALLIVLVIVVGVVTGLRRRAAPANPEADRLRDEVRDLRERLQVLERIVTDHDSALDLDVRIARLRDR